MPDIIHPALLAALGLATVLIFFFMLWLWQRRFGDASIVDVFWSWSIGLLALLYAGLGSGAVWPRVLLALLVGLWAMRLATYLGMRYAGKSKEDERYTQLRQEWGDQQQWKMLRFYCFQGIASWVVALAFLPIVYSAGTPHWLLLALAGGWWLFAVFNESLADAQLLAFRKAENKGKVCQVGWWRYSRHPNYFFEWLHWCCYPLLAICAGWWGLLALIAPVFMYIALTRLTGVNANEEHTRSSRPGYADYVQNTNAFFPGRPASSAE